MSSLITLVTRTDFLAGLAVGLAVAVLAAVVAVAVHRPLPLWGVAVAAISLASNWWTSRPPPFEVTLAVAAAAAAAALPRVAPWLPLGGLLLAGSLLAGTVDPTLAWLPWGTFLFVLLGSRSVVWTLARLEDPAVKVAMGLITVGGVFGTIPETDHMVPVAAAALTLTLAAWPLRAITLGAPGAAALVAALAWLIAAGGPPRPGSVVGAWLSLGAFLLVPILERLSPINPLSPRRILLVHLVVVIVASRVAGFLENPLPALAIGLIGLAAGGALLGRTAELEGSAVAHTAKPE